MVPAINCLNCGDVNAGVRSFSPPCLPDQEPRRQQRQGLVVMPEETNRLRLKLRLVDPPVRFP